MELMDVYNQLLKSFGPRNWWPAEGGFSPPEWEVCIGAILTQNTNWKNVERALDNLKGEGITRPVDILKIGKERLAELVKPSGYYNQKARKLKGFADFVLGFGGFRGFSKKVSREALLGVRGIGPETADSILLYALERPHFVVDAYTKRIFSRLGLLKECLDYEDIMLFFEKNIPKDVSLYKEYHALIVELGKGFCKTKPLCGECPLNGECKFRVQNPMSVAKI